MRAGIGLGLFYAGTLNAILAMSVGTCTRGDAGQVIGGAITLMLYCIALMAFLKTSRPGHAALFIFPACLVLVPITGMSIYMVYRMWGDHTACDIMSQIAGDASENGGEQAYGILWLLLSAVGWACAAVLATRWRRTNRAVAGTDRGDTDIVVER